MNLYIYCAGGFGKEVMDVARRLNEILKKWENIKFIDDVLECEHKYGAEVLKFNSLTDFDKFYLDEFLIANGEPLARQTILKKLESLELKLGVLVDSSSLVANSAIVNSGVIIAPFCSISSDAILRKNVCVNTMSIIGHDVVIGQNTVISSMVNIGGACVIGENSYIGMGALIKEGIHVGSNTIIGMGSVVYQDIPDGVIALGNPARVMRQNIDQKVFR